MTTFILSILGGAVVALWVYLTLMTIFERNAQRRHERELQEHTAQRLAQVQKERKQCNAGWR